MNKEEIQELNQELNQELDNAVAVFKKVGSSFSYSKICETVSYTHLTLPTILLV